MLFWTPLLEYIKIRPSPIWKLSPDAKAIGFLNAYMAIAEKVILNLYSDISKQNCFPQR